MLNIQVGHFGFAMDICEDILTLLENSDPCIPIPQGDRMIIEQLRLYCRDKFMNDYHIWFDQVSESHLQLTLQQIREDSVAVAKPIPEKSTKHCTTETALTSPTAGAPETVERVPSLAKDAGAYAVLSQLLTYLTRKGSLDIRYFSEDIRRLCYGCVVLMQVQLEHIAFAMEACDEMLYLLEETQIKLHAADLSIMTEFKASCEERFMTYNQRLVNEIYLQTKPKPRPGSTAAPRKLKSPAILSIRGSDLMQSVVRRRARKSQMRGRRGIPLGPTAPRIRGSQGVGLPSKARSGIEPTDKSQIDKPQDENPATPPRKPTQ